MLILCTYCEHIPILDTEIFLYETWEESSEIDTETSLGRYKESIMIPIFSPTAILFLYLS